MAQKKFFSNGTASDPTYIAIRDMGNERAIAARANCEELWDLFEPYADPEFLIEVRNNFDARYWEMYLTVYFLKKGFEISCPKPGPDVGILYEGMRVWFEATCPTRGAEGSADQVQLPRVGVAQYVPNEQMVLRYLNSISDKCANKYPLWLKKGVVKSDEAFVVALNPRQLGHEYGDTQPPRILQAAFQLGPLYASIDVGTGKIVQTGYQFRDSIPKSSGAKVTTGVFRLHDCSHLSGLLCSRIDVANRPAVIGADFQLVPNPKAEAPLPDSFRLAGTYFRVEHMDGRYKITPEERPS